MENTNTQIFESVVRLNSTKHMVGTNSKTRSAVLSVLKRKRGIDDHNFEMFTKLVGLDDIFIDCHIFQCYYDYISAKRHMWDSSESSLYPNADTYVDGDPNRALVVFNNTITNLVTRVFMRVTELIRNGCDVYVELSEPGVRRSATNVGKMKLFTTKPTERTTTIFRLTTLMKYAKLHKFTDTSDETVNGVSILHVQFPQNNDGSFKFHDELLGTVKSFDMSEPDAIKIFTDANTFGNDGVVND